MTTHKIDGQWKQIIETQIVPMTRPGWRGIWDAVVAWWTKTEPRTVPTPVTASMYVRTGDGSERDLNVEIWGAQSEIGAP